MNIIERFLPEICYTTSRNRIRPLNDPIGSIIHFISGGGRWGNFKDDPFNVDLIINEILIKYELSYHFLIDFYGKVYQLMPLKYQAFHAGKSTLHGRNYCNSFCFGVAFTSIGKYTTEQLKSGIELHKYLIKDYGIQPEWIAGHDTVRTNWNNTHSPDQAGKPKIDPGPDFPWISFMEGIKI